MTVTVKLNWTRTLLQVPGVLSVPDLHGCNLRCVLLPYMLVRTPLLLQRPLRILCGVDSLAMRRNRTLGRGQVDAHALKLLLQDGHVIGRALQL